MKLEFSLAFLFTLKCLMYYVPAKAALTNLNVRNELPAMESSWSDSLDWNLLKSFSSENAKNVIISPVSLKIALALLYEGSSGATAKEFQYSLNFPENMTVLRNHYKQLIDVMKVHNDNYDINFESTLFLDQKIEPVRSYSTKASAYYNASVQPTNFDNVDEAVKQINSWVSSATRGKITKLVTSDNVQDSLLMVVNALYFKGFWDVQFPKSRTHSGGFYVSPDRTLSVQYMSTTGRYFFSDSKELDAKLLRIPFKENKYSFYVILPNTKAGLHDLIKKLTVKSLKRNIDLMDEMTVDINLPKFKFDFQASYVALLQNLGLTQMFQNTASLSGIAREGHKFMVSNILQKAGIEVNEEGSTAYASTAVQLVNKFGEAESTFNATYPFVFFIQENTVGSVLFVGKVQNPLESESIFTPTRFADVPSEPTIKPGMYMLNVTTAGFVLYINNNL